jgi:hypothetical protein
VAVVDGGFSSGEWGTPAGWGCSVYYPFITNGGWGLGAWGSDGWGLGNDGIVSASDIVSAGGTTQVFVSETATASDIILGNLLRNASISEGVTAADIVSSLASFGVSVTDTASAY